LAISLTFFALTFVNAVVDVPGDDEPGSTTQLAFVSKLARGFPHYDTYDAHAHAYAHTHAYAHSHAHAYTNTNTDPHPHNYTCCYHNSPCRHNRVNCCSDYSYNCSRHYNCCSRHHPNNNTPLIKLIYCNSDIGHIK
jgi:hypothetical protein